MSDPLSIPLAQTTEIVAGSPNASTALSLALVGPHEHKRVRLGRRQRVLIGKRAECDLQLSDPSVSSQHASIEWRRDHYEIRDLASTNGTYVDGVLVGQARLSEGARIRVGRTMMRVVRSGAAPTLTSLPPSPIIGSSPAVLKALRTLYKLAPIEHPILLRGETGTGKELFARTLHAWSPRARAPFVAVNCAAIPSGLAESELFGHVKGAFTSAHRDRDGAFARADGGTLFLDEVGELALDLQAKLLRALECKSVRPVGAENERRVDVRIVTATHRDLEAMLQARILREDLYHRLGVLELNLPPLRERREDIPVLLEHFAGLIGEELKCSVQLCPNAISAAESAPWSGNVRALRNAVTRAAALADGVISTDLLLGSRRQMSSQCADGYIEVARGPFAKMQQELVARVVSEEGSIRRASQVLKVPRSTLGAWLRRD